VFSLQPPGQQAYLSPRTTRCAADNGIASAHRPARRSKQECLMELFFAKQIIVPLVLFICITIAFKALLETIGRYRLLKEGVSSTLLADLLQHDARQRRLASLRWGIFLVAIGLGFALLAIATGAGQLLYFRLSQRIS
jgi:hypothetical protein